MGKNKIKKVALTLSLAAVIGLGGTLAYINNVTETVTNTFKSDNNHIGGKVEEKKWDEAGKNQAQNYQPGDVIAKDPVVSLEEGSENAWVGMTLDFINNKDEKLDYESFKKYAEYDGINAKWTLIAKNNLGSELYMYHEAKSAGESTDPIFNNIKVNAGITTVKDITQVTHKKLVTKTDGNGNITREYTEEKDQPQVGVTYYDENNNIIGDYVADGATKLPQFKIDVTGYAVQSANNDDVDDVKKQLIDLANSKTNDENNKYVATVQLYND